MNLTGTTPELFNGVDQMQAMNFMALQNIQNYLKMLILRVNVAQPEQLASATEHTSVATSPNSIEKMFPMPNTDLKPQMPLFAGNERAEPKVPQTKNQKASDKLWKLMAKKYATKKIKRADENPKESPEEGETYRKLNGVLIPVLKNQVPM